MTLAVKVVLNPNTTNQYNQSKRHILDSSAKLKGFADDNFKFDENGRKLSKRVVNTVGKGEIARYEQFLLFPQCFQKTYTADTQNQGLLGKGLKKGGEGF